MDGNAVTNPEFSLPTYAQKVLAALEGAGYDAWVVGGWVRDAMRGVAGHDGRCSKQELLMER